MTERAQSRATEVLALLGVAIGYGAWFAQVGAHLPSTVISDTDQTGWTSLIAGRITQGQRPFADFDTVVGPGALLVMSLLQRAVGAVRLIDELRLIALLRVGCSVVAYFLSRAFVTRRSALFAAIATLGTLWMCPLLDARVYLAALSSWTSLLLGVRALGADERAQRRLWLGAGIAAGATFAFEFGQALAVLSGWLVALAVERRRLSPVAPRFAAGTLGGVLLTVLLGCLLGGTPTTVARDVLVDPFTLFGSPSAVLIDVGRVLAARSAFSGSIVGTVLVAWIVVRARNRDFAPSVSEVGRVEGALLAVLALVLLGGATGRLAGAERDAWTVAPFIARFELLVGVGVPIVCLFAVAPAGERAGHSAIRIAALVSLAATVTLCLGFRVNDAAPLTAPLVAVAWAAAMETAVRAGVPRLATVLTGFSLFLPLGVPLARASAATTPVTSGYWSGLKVNVRGVELLRAAERVRALTPDGQTALVLPDDPQLVALIGRPRPPLRGAAVFVDQYPARLAAGDRAALAAAPPHVVVVHPRDLRDLRRLYGSRGSTSAALALVEHQVDRVLPDRYRLDSTFRAVYVWGSSQIDVWVEK